jgi:hypothetical protein
VSEITFHTVAQTALILLVDESFVRRLCRQNRLGYTIPREGRAWKITDAEIQQYRTDGPRRVGRPVESK